MLELVLEGVAAGGYCVARHEGQVVFVRGGIVGERVRASVLQRRKKLLFARVVEVLEASPERVQPPYPFGGAGKVGAFDLAHMQLEAQREYKRSVFYEQARRIGGGVVCARVESLAPRVEGLDIFGAWTPRGLEGGEELLRDGLGYRVRVDVEVLSDGQLAMSAFRAGEEKTPVTDLPFAHPLIRESALWAGRERISAELGRVLKPGRLRMWADSDGLKVLSSSGWWQIEGQRAWRLDPREGVRFDVPEVGEFRVAPAGFWQAHVCAPHVFGRIVRGLLETPDSAGECVGPWERGLELYSGAGLFTGLFARALGERGTLLAVEGSETATAFARENIGERRVEQISGWIDGKQIDTYARRLGGSVDCVLLDPPRAGAGPDVMRALSVAGARRIVYVSCDAAGMVRDLAAAVASGYELRQLHLLDAYPHTHHLESICLLDRD